MVSVVGKDERAAKRITCRSCASILEYNLPEVREQHEHDYSGGPDGCKWIVCPTCGKDVIIERW